jgi:asparagine synthase (glutamine-hydrolysing)
MLYYAILPNLPPSIQRGILLRAGSGRGQPFESWSAMRADHAAETGAIERSLANGFDPHFLPMSCAVEERMLMFDSGAGDAADIWLALQLKSGLQFRDPTAYRPLVEFCFGIPAEQFRRDGVDRRLARRMLEGRVPEAVRQETRVGFQCADWPLSFARMRGELLKDLRRMGANPEIARRIDCERLTRDLERWDGDASREAAERILLAVSRAVTAGRFVDYVEGRNL